MRTGRFSQVGTATRIIVRLHPLVIYLDSLLQLRFNRSDDFLSSCPSRVQATPLSCQSSVPTTSENSRVIRRQSLDFNCVCTNGTRSFAWRYARQQCTATAQRWSQCLVRNCPEWPQLVCTWSAARVQLPRRPFLSHHSFKRSGTAAFEIAGRCMMRLVTSCIKGRSPRTSAGATLLRAFSVVRAYGQSTSWSTWVSPANCRVESNLHKNQTQRFCTLGQLEFHFVLLANSSSIGQPSLVQFASPMEMQCCTSVCADRNLPLLPMY